LLSTKFQIPEIQSNLLVAKKFKSLKSSARKALGSWYGEKLAESGAIYGSR